MNISVTFYVFKISFLNKKFKNNAFTQVLFKRYSGSDYVISYTRCLTNYDNKNKETFDLQQN